MKSLDELKALRDKLRKASGGGPDGEGNTRVTVGMATCGIAAGARPVLEAIAGEIDKRRAQHVKLAQTGCIGICQFEPIVEVYAPGAEKVTYVKMTPEKAARVVSSHIINGNIVSEYTIGAHTD